MRTSIDRTLTHLGGVASRRRLLTGTPAGQLDDEIRRGHLARPFRNAYCRPWDADLPEMRIRAALASTGAPVCLSHLSAEHRWGLIDRPQEVHVTIPATRMVRPQPGIRVHRVSHFPPVRRLDGLVTTTVAASVAASWPLSAGIDQRAAAIRSVRERLCSATQLREELARHSRLTGRASLSALVELLAAGCESELEIWGHLNVFDHPGLRDHRAQYRLNTRVGRVRIDLAYVAERLAVELDGDRWHSTPEQRERDRRRDSALAAAGWMTLRFSHRRLHDDPAGCRAETLAALAARRR